MLIIVFNYKKNSFSILKPLTKSNWHQLYWNAYLIPYNYSVLLLCIFSEIIHVKTYRQEQGNWQEIF